MFMDNNLCLKRRQMLKEIGEIRKSTVLTYVTVERANLNHSCCSLEYDDMREFVRHVKDKGKVKNLDLVIISNGGDSVVSWFLVNLLRECAEHFSVLIPFNAFSCATAIAIGADEIVMTKMGHLGPIDSSVGHPLNPPDPKGRNWPIAVEDIAQYYALAKDMYDIKDEENVTKVFEKLSEKVHPLALGNAYKSYLKARLDAKKLLELHLDLSKNAEEANKIVDTFVEKLYYHGHPVNRTEAKKIGLNVVSAEKISAKLDGLLFDLYENYEKELLLDTPYADELPSTGNQREVLIKFIESSDLCSYYAINQTFEKYPVGTKQVTQIEGDVALVDETGGNPIRLLTENEFVVLNRVLYEKKEVVGWKTCK